MSSLDDIAITIDREGFEALAPHVIDGVLALAAAAEASPVLAEVLADDDEPAPVRERAFGLLARQISAAATTGQRSGARRLGPSDASSDSSATCSSNRTRSRRSRVPVPASGADWRSNWPVDVPALR